ncbi:MAG: alpha-hydroxy-acid oxidizing protein [Trueperaceae bacterium]|nr:alpha-hydroxy-acid oxidizing protein [Trueperaceae bacterium]
MLDRDIAALESYQLIARVLHDVHEVSTQTQILGLALSAPIMPLVETKGSRLEPNALSLIDADALEGSDSLERVIPLLKSDKMGNLMPKVRKLSARGIPALALDFTQLAETPPFGTAVWKPKTREDLAELRAAAGCPLWLYGITSPSDAVVAMEAGLEAIVVHSGAGYYLEGPATIEIFPEVFDTVAGMIEVYAGGPVRNGVDIFRYLAVGAEAVVVDTDRPLLNLQAELEYAMRLTACETLADISYEAIFAPMFEEI